MLGSVVQVHLSPPHTQVRAARLLSAVAATAVIAAGAAFAQLRSIPDDAKRGQIRHVREMIVEIDGTQARLSPGAQIRNTENRIVLPGALPQETLLVKYQVDAAGMVHRVWILTPEEAAKPDKKP
jgi:hypothetical protein